jgi:hypothetical protein
MREKTTKHLSLCSSASTNLQFTIFHLDRHPPVANKDTNPLRHQSVQIMRTPILSGTNMSQIMRTPILSGTNLSQIMRTPILSSTNLLQIMRTPILSELQLTLAPPATLIQFKKKIYRTRPFSSIQEQFDMSPVPFRLNNYMSFSFSYHPNHT